MTFAFRVHMWAAALLARIDKGRPRLKAFRGFPCLLFYMCSSYEMSHLIYFHLVEETWFNIDAFLTYLSRPSVKNLTLRPVGHSYSSLFSEFWLFLFEYFTRSSHKAFQVCHYQGRPLTILFIVCQSINVPIIPTLFSQHWAKLLSNFFHSSTV